MKRLYIILLIGFILLPFTLESRVITVLSIDGGGIRGIIPAMILSHLEEKLQQPISDSFDLMVGTSTGGLIALCLACPDEQNNPKYTAHELVSLYENFGQTVFDQSIWHKAKTLNGWIGPKYDHENLENILKQYLGDARLRNALTEVVIPALDLSDGDTEFFTTNQARTRTERNFLMRDLARATSAAPTYFSPFTLKEDGQDIHLVDGGLTVNNPTIASYIYAINQFKENDSELFFVSIGTGDVHHTATKDAVPYEEVVNAGKMGWVKYILNMIMDGTQHLTNEQMRLISPQYKNNAIIKTHYIRIQIPIGPEHGSMDNASPENIKALKEYANQAIAFYQKEIDLIVSTLQKAKSINKSIAKMKA